MGRAPCCEKVGLKRGRWTKEEDEILLQYIATNGEGSWRSLPKNAGLLRCGKSCRLRWINYLRADLKRGNITKEEEEIIIKMHASIGNRWSLIAGKLPGRTDNEIKNYWNSHLSRRVDSFRRLRGAAELTVADLSKLPGASMRRGGRRVSRAAAKKKDDDDSTGAIVSREKRKEELDAADSAGSARSAQSEVEDEEEAVSTITGPDHRTPLANSSSITSDGTRAFIDPDEEMVADLLCPGVVLDQSGRLWAAAGSSEIREGGGVALNEDREGGDGHDVANAMGPEVGAAVGVVAQCHEEAAGWQVGSLLLDTDLDAKSWEEAGDVWSWLLDYKDREEMWVEGVEGPVYQEDSLHSWISSDVCL